MPFFEVTDADGNVEEIEADELRDAGSTPFLTFVNYRVLFVTTIYVEIVRLAGSTCDHRRRSSRIDSLMTQSAPLISAELRAAARAIGLSWHGRRVDVLAIDEQAETAWVIEIDSGGAHWVAVADLTWRPSSKQERCASRANAHSRRADEGQSPVTPLLLADHFAGERVPAFVRPWRTGPDFAQTSVDAHSCAHASKGTTQSTHEPLGR
jgi:hypothetical protein